jgi:PHD/YefM family antitoxin component YafN of YafNO toxin-antitoxin module
MYNSVESKHYMTTLTASEIRIPPATFNSVVFKGARVGINRRDGEVVYIISAQDLRLLEALEDRLDAEDVREALARHQAAGGHTVSLDELKRHIES